MSNTILSLSDAIEKAHIVENDSIFCTVYLSGPNCPGTDIVYYVEHYGRKRYDIIEDAYRSYMRRDDN